VLLLFAPPGSAKSTYVSVLLPSWYLAANPTHSILAATHNVEFAERWGRIYGGSDYAVTADGGDYTVHFIVGWILKAACICSTAGASRAHRTNGSRRSVILCLSGSRSAGLRKRVKSVPALDQLWISVKREEGLLLSPAVPDAGRQGSKSAVNSWSYGFRGSLRTHLGELVSRVQV
jgi:hypothetical protein